MGSGREPLLYVSDDGLDRIWAYCPGEGGPDSFDVEGALVIANIIVLP